MHRRNLEHRVHCLCYAKIIGINDRKYIIFRNSALKQWINRKYAVEKLEPEFGTIRSSSLAPLAVTSTYEDASDPDTRRLGNLLSSFDIVQHVISPTHRWEILSTSLCRSLTVHPSPSLCSRFAPSNHALVTSQLPVGTDLSPLACRHTCYLSSSRS